MVVAVCKSLVATFLAVVVCCSLPDYRDHECIRPCREDTQPRVCRYHWLIENYLTLSRACYSCPGNQTDCLRDHCVSADGVRRSVRTTNRAIPGPGIQVCEGDTIEVEVMNQMGLSEGLTIHWHGMHQPRFPHMDGVAMVTQCPVSAFSSFTYRFVAEAVAGTHWWHSHSGLYRGDGLFGPLVIRQPPSRDPHHALYDHDLPEHVMVLNDWPHQPVMNMFAAFYHSDGSESPESILVNGRGTYPPSRAQTVNGTNTPLAEFHVQPNTRYRFRVINAGSFRCPIQLSIEDHGLLLIASDARPFVPFSVKSFVSYSGERYDFVLHTKRLAKDGGSYWITAQGLADCARTGAYQLALLRYHAHGGQMEEFQADSATNTEQYSVNDEMIFNQWLVDADFPDERSQIASMTAVEPDDDSLSREPDQQFFIEFAYRHRNNMHYHDPDLYPVQGEGYSSMSSAMMNNISNILPTSPVLTQLHDLDAAMFCNSSTDNTRCVSEFCECTHRLLVTEGQVVEFVIYNANRARGFTHPLHLHGHSFRVVALDRMDVPMSCDLFLDLDRQGQIKRNLHKAPYKDTLPIPDGGYVILRIKADNPGAWYMHCHAAFHSEIGMSLTLQVNNAEGHLPSPPPDFPRCGQWPPTSDVAEGKCHGDEGKLKQGQAETSTFSVVPGQVVVVALVGILGAAIGLTVVLFHLHSKRAKERQRSQASPASCRPAASSANVEESQPLL